MFEDANGVIRNRNSKDKKQNGERKLDRRTNTDLQNTTQKAKHRATQTPLRSGA